MPPLPPESAQNRRNGAVRVPDTPKTSQGRTASLPKPKPAPGPILPPPLPKRREDLLDLRRRLVAALETAETRDLAALSRELRQVTAELELVPAVVEVSKVDELANRRAAGRAASNTRTPARRGRSVSGS